MLSALKQFPWEDRDEPYQKIPLDEGTDKILVSIQRPDRRLLQLVSLRHVLIFLLGLGVGLVSMLPSLVSRRVPSHASTKPPNNVIPSQVFTPKIPTSWVPDDRYIGFSAFSNSMWHHLVKSKLSAASRSPHKFLTLTLFPHVSHKKSALTGYSD